MEGGGGREGEGEGEGEGESRVDKSFISMTLNTKVLLNTNFILGRISRMFFVNYP